MELNFRTSIIGKYFVDVKMLEPILQLLWEVYDIVLNPKSMSSYLEIAFGFFLYTYLF